MGIDNLLSFLKPITLVSHISSFENQTVVVDAMSWLYRGCYSCAYELNMGIPTKDFLYFLNKSVLMLRRHHIKPILVFDGRHLFVKKKTEDFRKKTKQENLAKAKEFLEKGDEKEAKKYFSRSIKITKSMIYQAIDLLKQMKVDYILAPYEADAQMAYLIKNSYAHLAISEDSDLIAYGCTRIILKLSTQTGECQFLNLNEYRAPSKRASLSDKQLKNFLSFDEKTVIYACIMAGCDYLPSIKGIGIKKAVDFLARNAGKLEGAVRRLQFEKTFMGRIPQDYAKTVEKIALVFKFQRVFEPKEHRFATLNPLPESFSPQDNVLIGEEFKDVEEFTQGNLDIKKLEKREVNEKDLQEIFKMEAQCLQNIEKIKRNAESSKENKENEENFYDFEEENEGIVIIYDKKQEKKEKNNKENNQEKIEDQIDYLFEICKEFSEELQDKCKEQEEGKSQETSENHKKDQIIENKENKLENIFEKFKKSSHTKKSKEKLSKSTNEIPKNNKITENINAASPFNPNKNPINPFAIEENSVKKEGVLLMDSIKKLSTEKIENKNSVSKIISPLIEKTILSKRKDYDFLNNNYNKNDNFFEKPTNKKERNTINNDILVNNGLKIAKKSMKTNDGQKKIQSFFKKI